MTDVPSPVNGSDELESVRACLQQLCASIARLEGQPGLDDPLVERPAWRDIPGMPRQPYQRSTTQHPWCPRVGRRDPNIEVCAHPWYV
jgi:hypothetical protein